MRIWPISNYSKKKPYGVNYIIFSYFILDNYPWYAAISEFLGKKKDHLGQKCLFNKSVWKETCILVKIFMVFQGIMNNASS